METFFGRKNVDCKTTEQQSLYNIIILIPFECGACSNFLKISGERKKLEMNANKSNNNNNNTPSVKAITDRTSLS